MVIDWLKFLAALALLLTPIGLFHGGKVRYRPVSRDWDRHWRAILGLGLHSIDLVRAMLGAWLLVDALAVVPGAKGLMRHAVLLAHVGVLWAAMFLQAVVCKEPSSVHAPLAFATGLVLGYFSPQIGGFAVLFAAVLVAGARMPAAYFPVLALALYGTGVLHGGKRMLLQVTVVAFAVVIPWFLNLMFRQRMVISYRARRTTDPTRVPFADATHR